MQDLHTHSLFCDGKNSPEEMVLAAIDKGLDRYGISGHSFVAFDTSCCMPVEDYPKFKAEMERLKEKYRGRIEILCGIEQDYYSEAGTEGFDYIIGSVHYLEVNGDIFSVDDTPAILEEGCRKHFGGDYYALCEAYFDTVSDIVEKTHCDIIGHFDLVTKFNEKGHYFSESHPRYVAAYKRAVEKLVGYGKPFEINTGAMTRGYRSIPYPAPQIVQYIKECGGSLIYASDAHSREHIAAYFDVSIM